MIHTVKYFLKTYGCQMNVYDSHIIRQILNTEGMVEVSQPHLADVIIVNTCAVRAHAENRAISWVKQVRKNGQRVGIVGCVAGFEREKLIDKGIADFVLGPDHYSMLPSAIEGKIQIAVEPTDETYSSIYARQMRGSSSFVAIMRGCNNFCSYCVVPYIRGRERSRSPERIIDEVKKLVDKGIKEVILLGQNVNSYTYNHYKFPDILEKVALVPGVVRVDFTASHPKDISPMLFDVMKHYPNIARHLHLPVQSGSNKVLKLMGRKYTKEDYLKIIEQARSKVKDISITTDILVGFPGETDGDYLETIEMVKYVRFDFAYMFYYSPRHNTLGALLPGLIPEKERKKRLQNLIDIQNKITYEKNREMLEKIYIVIVQGKSKTGEWLGTTPQQKTVIFKGKTKVGELTTVYVQKLSGWTPYGIQVQGGA